MNNVVITRGMANVLITPSTNVKIVCKECGLVIPKYRGKYPSACPSCHAKFLAVAQESVQEYYGQVCEAFMAQRIEIGRLHEFRSGDVRVDLVRQIMLPYLLEMRQLGDTKGIFEALYAGLFQPPRTPSPADVKLFEASSCGSETDTSWSYFAAKTIGVYTPIVLEDTDLKRITSAARRIYRNAPAWLPSSSSNALLSEARQRQLLSEAYSFSRQYAKHVESLEYATQTLMNEAIWVSQLPPSSVLNPRKRGERRAVVGGFRFRVGGKDPQGKTKEIHRRIASKKNKSGGVASTLTAARKILQRRQAQRKATAWHRMNPKSPRLHRGLGQLLHRSQGRYQPTQEGVRRLKRLRESENSLRIFMDGTPYYMGRVFNFCLGKNLLESQIKRGTSYRIRQPLPTQKLGGNAAIVLPVGTNIKIESKAPARSWERDLGYLDIEHNIYEISVTSGLHNYESHVVFGNDLATALGIDEGTRLSSKIVHREGCHGAVYLRQNGIRIQEVVVSCYDNLISDSKLGSILRVCQHRGTITETTKVRVYNDAPQYNSLQEEMNISRKTEGRRLVEERGHFLILEKDEAQKQVIKEEVFAGGPGGWIETLNHEVVGTDVNTTKVLRLPPGTKIQHRVIPGDEEEVSIVSGPYTGKQIKVLESFFNPVADIGKIHRYYLRIV